MTRNVLRQVVLTRGWFPGSDPKHVYQTTQLPPSGRRRVESVMLVIKEEIERHTLPKNTVKTCLCSRLALCILYPAIQGAGGRGRVLQSAGIASAGGEQVPSEPRIILYLRSTNLPSPVLG